MTDHTNATRTRSSSPYADLVDLCGLELGEAAAFFGVAPNTARRRASGRLPVSEADMKTLVELWGVIVNSDADVFTDGRPLPAGALARRRGLRLLASLGGTAALPKQSTAKGSTSAASSTAEPKRTRKEMSAIRKAEFRRQKNQAAAADLPDLSGTPWTYDGLADVKPGDTLRILDRPDELMTVEGPDGKRYLTPGLSGGPQELVRNGRKVKAKRQTIATVTHIVGDQVYFRVAHSRGIPEHMHRELGYEGYVRISGFNSKAAENGPITSIFRSPADAEALIAHLERKHPTPAGLDILPSSFPPAGPVAQTPSVPPASPPLVEAVDEATDDDWPYKPEDAVSEEGISGMSMPWNREEFDESISY